MVYLFYLNDIERAVPKVEGFMESMNRDLKMFEKIEILHNGWIHYESKDEDWVLIQPDRWSGTYSDLMRLITNNRPIVLFVSNDYRKEFCHHLLINNLTISVIDYDNIVGNPV